MWIKQYIFALAVLVVLGTFFADKGIVDSYKLTQRLRAEQNIVEQLARENENLRKKIELLKTDVRYVEMVARHDLGMVTDGEMVIYMSASQQKRSN